MDAETRAVLEECRTIVQMLVEDGVIRSHLADRVLLARITGLVARPPIEWTRTSPDEEEATLDDGRKLFVRPAIAGTRGFLFVVFENDFEYGGNAPTPELAKAAAEAAAGVK